MKFSRVTVSILLLTVLAAFALATFSSTSAANVIGTPKISSESIVSVPTAATTGDAVNHGQYGNVEVWVNATAVPTAFTGSVVVQQASSSAGPWIDVTPTVVSGSGTITYTTRTAPTVFGVPRHGTYTRLQASNTSAVTGTLSVRWHLSNTEE